MLTYGFELEYHGSGILAASYRRPGNTTESNYVRSCDDPFILYGYQDGSNYEMCSTPQVGLLRAMKSFRYFVIAYANSGKASSAGNCGRYTGCHISVDNLGENPTLSERRAFKDKYRMISYRLHEVVGRIAEQYKDAPVRRNNVDQINTLFPLSSHFPFYNEVVNRFPYSSEAYAKCGFIEFKHCRSTFNPYAFLKYLAFANTCFYYLSNPGDKETYEQNFHRLYANANNPHELINIIKELSDDPCSPRSIIAICNEVAKIVNPSFSTNKVTTFATPDYHQLGYARNFLSSCFTDIEPTASQERCRTIASFQHQWITNGIGVRRSGAVASMGSAG